MSFDLPTLFFCDASEKRNTLYFVQISRKMRGKCPKFCSFLIEPPRGGAIFTGKKVESGVGSRV